MDKTAILNTALSCGFVISNFHGTGEGMPQPTSDCATLIDFAREVIRLYEKGVMPNDG